MTDNLDRLSKYFKQTLKPTVRTNVSQAYLINQTK